MASAPFPPREKEVIFAQRALSRVAFEQLLTNHLVGIQVSILQVFGPDKIRNCVAHQVHEIVKVLMPPPAQLQLLFRLFPCRNIGDDGVD